MPAPRELTDVAIDSAIHRLAEPKNGWRGHLPPADLGAMKDAGSGQITLQALVAALEYGPRPWAVATLNTYADLCPSRFMLSEPWSRIYGNAIVCCWLATVVLAERHGEHELGQRFRALLRAWAATCSLMETHFGRIVVYSAGCRSWGAADNWAPFDWLWRIARGNEAPAPPGSKQYGKPGAYDDWGWIRRCASLGYLELRGCAQPYVDQKPLDLVANAPRWAARTEMQLLGWQDGSRLWLMGDDEAGRDDEDENSNTPGWLAAGVLGGKLVTLPRWPDPLSGKTHIRQTNTVADLDGDPIRGWTLWHSHLGERHAGGNSGGFVTDLPPYKPDELLFHVLIRAGDLDWKVRVPADDSRNPPIPRTPESPHLPNNPNPPARKPSSWIERMGL